MVTGKLGRAWHFGLGQLGRAWCMASVHGGVHGAMHGWCASWWLGMFTNFEATELIYIIVY